VTGAVAVDARARLWLVDKPAGPTSHDVVASVRRGLPRSVKVGHAGTLDPFATGLLVVLSGGATRLAPLLSGLDKRYLATVRTGFTSATGDPEGPISASGAPADIARVEEALAGLRGRRAQRVPAYSAVKVGGERLYARARRGEPTAAPERTITIHALDLVDDLGDGRAVVAVHCSKGTYVRRLAEEIGEAIGCGAYCEALRRTHVGELSVDDALPPERALEAGGIDPVAGLRHVPAREITAEERAEVAHGRPIRDLASGQGPAGATVLLVHAGELAAVAERDAAAGLLRPRVVLAAPEPGG
jgi:tRNA pseudouridine55 synthase